MPLIVLAGAEYGTGSSRDWAAKGTFLLGVRAVIAASFERIHRSNLVGMGVLPLRIPQRPDLAIAGPDRRRDVRQSAGLDDSLAPRSHGHRRATAADGKLDSEFQARVRIDTPVELDYYRNGGILQTVLRKLLKA